MEQITIHFNLNGKDVTVSADPNKRLVDFLREDMGMTSVKEGCGEGECGACTIIYNGKAVTSCLMLAGQVDGAAVVTLEGVSENGELNYIQQAFVDAGAVQCGYCTPGMVLSAKALLDKKPDATNEEIKRAMSGNLCRCTGYAKIIEAVETARDVKGGGKA
ncbi:(2Fe-2S)-binding protein [Pseudoflavonifractor phocaeensis]|uniref:(2Fe-2S)-binding protein n=1 Tax=Pseudoflavonifractor phocaeensis TaxID=1870988 RepID=UPI0012BC5216|nr:MULTISPECIES: (2Fe-2S)-binding protein [Pseudoflavonifractor]MTQ97945.1 2Fe-2S iron-sulfur cluster binding domain-containing protein [Pseudoflavonifractor sp. BIOML-A16]MTR07263.1 2Fe-2S iron-sulfur cluster binding domain-containing protein [Pseudoflavonifractor sp. BIOML-A15]MTR32849.1 2Fe-2S iron-sulfur cluster binding domain-containing protein [Pseudoflavonifractor sp. BIOML-A14]MTR74203.1 2Fe-2S iron-sulfur cluster binding domain-containing protein [Pseudoflavonifractor sp. BIOML-A18]MT